MDHGFFMVYTTATAFNVKDFFSMRKAQSYLMTWIHSKNRKPIVIRGARQVGKTWMVRQLAQLTGKQLIELNFERRLSWHDLFSSNDPKEI